MSSGWTLDEILDLSIGQISCALECVMTYKAEQLDLVLDIASQALGGKKKGKSKASKGRTQKQVDKKQKEQAFLQGIANSGLEITNV